MGKRGGGGEEEREKCSPSNNYISFYKYINFFINF